MTAVPHDVREDEMGEGGCFSGTKDRTDCYIVLMKYDSYPPNLNNDTTTRRRPT